MSEKLCLQWNDFNENVEKAVANLRQDSDFNDVTLVSEDGQNVEAHKVILAASSPFFNDMLVKNKHNHPLVYMRGVKAENLKAMVDFMYKGEASVSQESLDSFLALASELKLKGLMGTDEGDETEINRSTYQTETQYNDIKPNAQQINLYNDNEIGTRRPNAKRLVAKLDNFNGDLLAELDEKVKSMMEQGHNMISYGKGRLRKANVCKVCGKEGQIVAIRDHIEANHLEGVAIPCNFCEKTFRSRHSLRNHRRSQHNEN